jgi:hypothetical protein
VLIEIVLGEPLQQGDELLPFTSRQAGGRLPGGGAGRGSRRRG